MSVRVKEEMVDLLKGTRSRHFQTEVYVSLGSRNGGP